MAEAFTGQPFPPTDVNAPEAVQARRAAQNRAALRSGGAPIPTATEPVAAAAESAKTGGWFRRAAQGLRSGVAGAADAVAAAPGKASSLLDANVGSALRSGAGGVSDAVGGAVKSLRTGAARTALPLAAASSAYETFNTPTDDIAQRTGIERGEGSFLRDAGIRGVGALQDLGNTVTLGVADRVGNLIAGNGFNRSPEVGGAPPQTASADAPGVPGSPAAIAPNYSHEGRGSVPGSAPTIALPAGVPTGGILREGNSYSGKNIPFNEGLESNVFSPNGTRLAQGGLVKDGFGEAPSGLRGGGTVTSLDTREGYRQNLLELQRNAAERANPTMSTSFGDGGNTVGQAPGGFNSPDRRLSLSELVDKHNSTGGGAIQDALRDASPRGKIALTQALRASTDAAALRASNENIAAGHNATQSGIATQSNATQAGIAGMHNQATLRGQDLHLQGQMAPLQLAAMQRGMHSDVYRSVGAGGDTAPTADHHLAAANVFDKMGLTEQAKGAREAATQMQALKGSQEAQAETQRSNAGKAFHGLIMTTDKDGKPVVDKDMAEHIGAMTERYAPGFSKMGATQRAPIISHMAALGQLMNNGLNQDTKVGWRGLNPLAQTAPGSVEPPDITGAQLERIGNAEGLITKGASGGDYVITTKNAQHRITNPDSKQLAIIRQAISGKGWGPQEVLR